MAVAACHENLCRKLITRQLSAWPGPFVAAAMQPGYAESSLGGSCVHGREYGFVRYDPRDTRAGYLIYRADIKGSDALPVVTDGKNQETIDAVHRDCRFEGFVECRRGCV